MSLKAKWRFKKTNETFAKINSRHKITRQIIAIAIADMLYLGKKVTKHKVEENIRNRLLGWGLEFFNESCNSYMASLKECVPEANMLTDKLFSDFK